MNLLSKNGEGYIWSSDRQINQLFNQSLLPSWIKWVTIIKPQSTLALLEC